MFELNNTIAYWLFYQPKQFFLTSVIFHQLGFCTVFLYDSLQLTRAEYLLHLVCLPPVGILNLVMFIYHCLFALVLKSPNGEWPITYTYIHTFRHHGIQPLHVQLQMTCNYAKELSTISEV